MSRGIPCLQVRLERGERRFDRERAQQFTRELKMAPARPTAFLSFSNLMTTGALRAIRELDLKCPRDLAFVGIDDLV